jgi:mRNA interferase MazF
MKRGDVVLVDVPYVGSPGAKVRPALVVQNDALNKVLKETVIAAITSNTANAHQPHQVLIDISTLDGAATGLLTNSAIRCERLHSVPQSDIRKVIGMLSAVYLSEVGASLKSALAIP